jgi:hypothetical protein
MLLLNNGQVSEELIVTLNEKRTLDTGFYLFIFTHMLTKQVITKIFAFTDDESDYPDRYNSFIFPTAALFTGHPVGQWIYQVYEQVSASNVDPDGLTEVERGITMLKGTAFEFDSYNPATTYKTYGG